MAKYYAVQKRLSYRNFNTWDECKRRFQFFGCGIKVSQKLEDASFLGENEQISLFDEPKRKSTAVAYVDGATTSPQKNMRAELLFL